MNLFFPDAEKSMRIAPAVSPHPSKLSMMRLLLSEAETVEVAAVGIVMEQLRRHLRQPRYL